MSTSLDMTKRWDQILHSWTTVQFTKVLVKGVMPYVYGFWEACVVTLIVGRRPILIGSEELQWICSVIPRLIGKYIKSIQKEQWEMLSNTKVQNWTVQYFIMNNVSKWYGISNPREPIKFLYIYKHSQIHIHCSSTHYNESFYSHNTLLLYVNKSIRKCEITCEFRTDS